MSSSWKCKKCEQLNVGWASKCGRCDSASPRKPAETKLEPPAVPDTEEEPILKFTGYDEAIVGISNPWDTSGQKPTRLVYDGQKIMEILVSRDGMDHDEAAEFISFNTEGAYVGPNTPIVMWPYEPENEDPLGDAA